MRGWKKRGGEPHESRRTPLPKTGLGPLRLVRFPLPSGVVALFFLYRRSPRRRVRCLVRFPMKIRLSQWLSAKIPEIPDLPVPLPERQMVGKLSQIRRLPLSSSVDKAPETKKDDSAFSLGSLA